MTFAVRSWQRQSLVRVVISSWRAESSVSHSKFCDICGGFVATTKFGYARRVRVAISSWRVESSASNSKFCDIRGAFVAKAKFGYARRVGAAISLWGFAKAFEVICVLFLTSLYFYSCVAITTG